MTKERKRLQDKLRRKFKYNTCPIGTGTIICRGGFTPPVFEGSHKDYIRFEIGWGGRDIVNIQTYTKDRKAAYATISYEELELLYKLSQEIKKETEERFNMDKEN